MKFTQKEIFDLKGIVVEHKIPISFNIDKSDDSIFLTYPNQTGINSLLKRNKDGYRIDYNDSNDYGFYFESADWNDFKNSVSDWISRVKEDNPYEINIKENIKNISPNFYDIYTDAIMIEALGFNDSSGMIYRKSLEILIKDFFVKLLPESFEELIFGKTIGRLLFKFYEKIEDDLCVNTNSDLDEISDQLNYLRPLVKTIWNTFDIGNDFSHYERRLLEYSSYDMRKNIASIVEFVDNEIEKLKLTAMQEKLSFELDLKKLIKRN